ncbi:13912_t:CDS:2, partial [Funneliformis geosporum]
NVSFVIHDIEAQSAEIQTKLMREVEVIDLKRFKVMNNSIYQKLS